ncbi:IS21 family transposase [Photobacterium frigidiphilum]|uniref:IS21 family transposase n=1 Tax=Photobacterium frigidiphilum TaxID=264736 RepID=A0A2T3J5N2_9GAMM|nr:IS21 family transposase [Photobacterium frigidiphilum]PSU41276.1 IS21 family transposase [Photobacterium frigidiphilum]
MPTAPISMRKLKEILRLKYGAKLTHRQIAASLSISPSSVSTYANRAAQLGIRDWPLAAQWNDVALKQAFFNTQVKTKDYALPIWLDMKQELTSKTMTLQLLWQEYAERHPEGHYSYNHFCRQYRAWLKTQRLSMRQHHKAGEKLFVDYCGPTMDIVNPRTGEIRTAQVFVAVMGASNYTYAEATWSQGLEDWIMSHVRCFEFLGGVPELVIPDNLKSGVTKACRYEPDLNPTYQQLAEHYQTTVIPARPYKPKDKAKAEVGVQIVERWIMARLRHETFFSLRQLNQRIAELLVNMNNRQMKQHPGSRQSLFMSIDKPALKPLPQNTYVYTQVKKVRVHIDYHVEVDKHYYSVPHSLVKQQLEARITGHQVILTHQGYIVASHPRVYGIGGHTTNEQHMPVAHQKHQQWSPERFGRWAKDIGEPTAQLVGLYLQQGKHPEQSYRRCLGLLSLAKQYSPTRLNAACTRALATNVTGLKAISNMLSKGLEQQPLPNRQVELLSGITHENIRGEDYYH